MSSRTDGWGGGLDAARLPNRRRGGSQVCQVQNVAGIRRIRALNPAHEGDGGVEVPEKYIDFGPADRGIPVEVIRSLRLVLAFLDTDKEQIGSIADEIEADPRGGLAAHWQLTLNMAATVADLWSQSGDVRPKIRATLMHYASEEASNG